jgi:hypothetical protein
MRPAAAIYLSLNSLLRVGCTVERYRAKNRIIARYGLMTTCSSEMKKVIAT